MASPVYLTAEDVLEVYAAIIGGTGQQASDHLRSRNAARGSRRAARDARAR
jgi:hypothetical protein